MGIADRLFKLNREKAAKNKQAGEDFLAENANKEDIQVLPSGLQYEVIKSGEGPQPNANSTVTCHYKGYTIDNKVFDSSYQREKPAQFPLNRVIPGWTEGVQLMQPGSQYKFYIPYNLGYGEQQVGSDIAPYSALIFEIELISID